MTPLDPRITIDDTLVSYRAVVRLPHGRSVSAIAPYHPEHREIAYKRLVYWAMKQLEEHQ